METGAFLGGLDGPIDQLDLVHTSTNQVHTRVNTVHTSTYQYMHVMEYLGSDEVPNHEGQREHDRDQLGHTRNPVRQVSGAEAVLRSRSTYKVHTSTT